MNIDIKDIKIKIKLLNSKTIFAQATVILFDIWEEHGWKILKSNRLHDDFQEYIWIQAPSYKAYGAWKEIVFINNKWLYNKVQEKIYDAYHKTKTKKEAMKPAKKNEKGYKLVNVNADEIPF